MRALGRHSVSSFLVWSLTISRNLLAFILFIAVGLTIASPFIDHEGGTLSLPVAVEVDARILHLAAPTLGIPDVIAGPEQRGRRPRLRLRGDIAFPAPPDMWVIGPAVGALMIATALWIVMQLLALFRELRAGHPFAPVNASRVRRIAWTVIAIEPMRAIVEYGSTSFVHAHFIAFGLSFPSRMNLNVGTIFIGLVILVIAEVFRTGARLDEDQSLTI
jgi:TRAP-type C4-dicarboxylate transport system permease small subunit